MPATATNSPTGGPVLGKMCSMICASLISDTIRISW
jgi:hypothetical protein